MTLYLYQSSQGKKVPFVPLHPDSVGFYACGPTVYDRVHLGNGRTFLFFDLLFRLLRFMYPKVTYVRNITDVDDKINEAVVKTQENLQDFTQGRIQWFLEDTKDLNLLSPTFEPKATDFIQPILDLIKDLLEKGYAYEAEGHVLFHVAAWEHYGSLSHRQREDMMEGARVEVAPYKKDPLDFVLWKPSFGETPGWDSPWGYGRPGWHSECSVMSRFYLGPLFDLHGGGQDLLFPHHENERAQICAQEGTQEYARYWVHTGMLVVQGQKMSKSLGNFITLRETLEGLYETKAQDVLRKLQKVLSSKGYDQVVKESQELWIQENKGEDSKKKGEDSKKNTIPLWKKAQQEHHGHILKWALFSSHYRQELNWTKELYFVARHHLRHLYSALLRALEEKPKVYEPLLEALQDDLNTPKVLQVLVDLIKKTQKNPKDYGSFLWFSLDLLGFSVSPQQEILKEMMEPKGPKSLGHCVAFILHQRQEAKEQKKYTESDDWRDCLISCGLTLQDQGSTCHWFLS